MRAGILGGGLAGSLLAWRLARAATDWRIELIPGERCDADATRASGGAVRAYESHAGQRELAIASMAELLASRTLRRWADYRRLGSIYLKRSADGLAAELAEIDRMLSGSAQLVPAAELDWAEVPADAKVPADAEVPADAVAVCERDAGYLAPDRFRAAVLADAVRVTVRPGAVHAVTLGDNGTIRCNGTIGCDGRDYDVVILALGAWTGRFLRATGLPSEGYRVKSIQYAIHRTGGWRPPHFVDEITGLYGRPTADGGLLLGLPTNVWDVDPDRPPTDPALLDAAAELTRARFPRLRLGPAVRRVGSADCYADQPLLALRPVAGLQHRLFTFTGGAGGSVKTALAASHRAATQLVELQLNSLRTT
jgi:glycine/D-amino acid oxidase-like deaminating enzyme